jgi:SAM-dependent methyltransferase
MGQRLIQALPIGGARTVLDIGTGVGALISDLQAAAPGALVVGVDRAPGMLRIAQLRHATPLAVMDAQHLGIRPACMDAAVLIFMLFHVPDPVRALVEAAHALRPGGVVGVVTWGDEPAFPASTVWDEALDAFGAAEDSFAVPERHELMNTPEKLSDLLAQAGLEIIRVWSERFDHHWDPEWLYTLRTGCGSYARRLETLDPEQRAACLARVRERWAALGPDDFIYRPGIVFAIGRRSSGD